MTYPGSRYTTIVYVINVHVNTLQSLMLNVKYSCYKNFNH